MDQARFSVYRFLQDGSCDFVRDVPVDQAVEAFADSCSGIRRVVVMDEEFHVRLERQLYG